MKLILNIKQKLDRVCLACYFQFSEWKSKHAELLCFIFGIIFLTAGFVDLGFAQGNPITIDDSRLLCAAAALLALIEGNFGALIMIVAGIGTIIAVAFGGYNAAMTLLAVAVSGFILRSLVVIFFNTDIQGGQCTLDGTTITTLKQGPAST